LLLIAKCRETLVTLLRNKFVN